MSHWAELDSDNLVIRVVVCDNNDPAGDEGYSWLLNNLGGTWVQTSYNTVGGEHLLGGTPFRKNYAGVGYSYDEIRDAFIPSQPFPSWTLNEETCLWEAPTPRPAGSADFSYGWDEESLSWVGVSKDDIVE